MPDVISDVLRFIWSVIWQWVNVVGCTVITFATVIYPKITRGKEFPVSSWWILGGCLAVAVFLAWRDEYRKARSKTRRVVLTEIVDAFNRVKQPGEPWLDWIGLLIKHCDDFGTERDVKWICDRLEALHYQDPFAFFKLKYGKRAFNGKRLKFIRDARLARLGRDEIRTDTDAENYIYSTWADENSLTETVGKNRAKATVLSALNKWSNK